MKGFSEKEKSKIYRVVFVYLNQLQRFKKDIKTSALTSIFDYSGIKYLLTFANEVSYKVKIKDLFDVVIKERIPYSFIS